MDEQEVKAVVEARINKFLVEDAQGHRDFLERMFKRVTLSFGALAAVFGAVLYFVFGSSVEQAANANVKNFMGEQEVSKGLQKEIDASLSLAAPKIRESARQVAREAVEETVQAVADDKIEEIRGLNAEEILAAAVDLSVYALKTDLPATPDLTQFALRSEMHEDLCDKEVVLEIGHTGRYLFYLVDFRVENLDGMGGGAKGNRWIVRCQ